MSIDLRRRWMELRERIASDQAEIERLRGLVCQLDVQCTYREIHDADVVTVEIPRSVWNRVILESMAAAMNVTDAAKEQP